MTKEVTYKNGRNSSNQMVHTNPNKDLREIIQINQIYRQRYSPGMTKLIMSKRYIKLWSFALLRLSKKTED